MHIQQVTATGNGTWRCETATWRGDNLLWTSSQQVVTRWERIGYGRSDGGGDNYWGGYGGTLDKRPPILRWQFSPLLRPLLLKPVLSRFHVRTSYQGPLPLFRPLSLDLKVGLKTDHFFFFSIFRVIWKQTTSAGFLGLSENRPLLLIFQDGLKTDHFCWIFRLVWEQTTCAGFLGWSENRSPLLDL